MQINVNNLSESYEVIIKENVTSDIYNYLESKKYSKILLVTDDNIPKEYYQALTNQYNSIGQLYVCVLENGEKNKSLPVYEKIINLLLEKSFTKNDLLIAFGGGVIGDLCGFVASTYKRGMKYINVPTTMLAMVDSSIGGKTALDVGYIKNCIGTYTRIDKVFIDPSFLKSLPQEHYYNGLMESLKCALIGDKELFDLFKNNNFNKNDIDQNKTIITRSLMVKKKLIEKDYYDTNERRFLNFGHTLGHALELNLNLLHGYAVAIGMLFFSGKQSEDIKNIINKFINVSELIQNIKKIEKDKIEKCLLNDKKNDSNMVSVVLLSGIGEPYIKQMSVQEVMEAFDEIIYRK